MAGPRGRRRSPPPRPRAPGRGPPVASRNQTGLLVDLLAARQFPARHSLKVCAGLWQEFPSRDPGRGVSRGSLTRLPPLTPASSTRDGVYQGGGGRRPQRARPRRRRRRSGPSTSSARLACPPRNRRRVRAREPSPPRPAPVEAADPAPTVAVEAPESSGSCDGLAVSTVVVVAKTRARAPPSPVSSATGEPGGRARNESCPGHRCGVFLFEEETGEAQGAAVLAQRTAQAPRPGNVYAAGESDRRAKALPPRQGPRGFPRGRHQNAEYRPRAASARGAAPGAAAGSSPGPPHAPSPTPSPGVLLPPRAAAADRGHRGHDRGRSLLVASLRAAPAAPRLRRRRRGTTGVLFCPNRAWHSPKVDPVVLGRSARRSGSGAGCPAASGSSRPGA